MPRGDGPRRTMECLKRTSEQVPPVQPPPLVSARRTSELFFYENYVYQSGQEISNLNV
jgi:hypothetical protein